MNDSRPSLDPSIIVIFGITGDLSQRYLLPSLYHLVKNDLLHEHTEIIGISRREMSSDELLIDVDLDLNDSDGRGDPDAIAKLKQKLRMVQMDVTNPDDYHRLHETLDSIEDQTGMCMNRLYYLSIPPQVYGPIIKLMGEAGMNASCQHGAAQTRLLVEKPFGYDLPSAQSLIEETGQVFGEEQIYRIDHYLARETVQNILVFRFDNPIFEPLWNNQHVSSIEISASEKIGVEGRANFYEPVGALRDFIQSHLMQILAIVTMDKPEVMDSEHIHASKQRLLEQVETIPADQVQSRALRAQYEDYRGEVGNESSTTETFAAIRLSINSDRWRDVPILIWTGKALDQKRTEIKVTFNAEGEKANELRFRIQPNEGIELDLLTKEPGYDLHLQTASMDFSYAQKFAAHEHPNAYERVLVDAVRGDHTLFATSEEVLSAWRIIQPVLDEWRKRSDDLTSYASGTPGNDILHAN